MTLTHLRSGLFDVQRDGDGFKAVRADPIVAATVELFVAWCVEGVFTATSSGDILLAGTVRYRLVGVDEGRNLILQRIDEP